MFNSSMTVPRLQLKWTLQALMMTKSVFETWLTLQPQPSRVTSPLLSLLPALTGRDVVLPSPPPERGGLLRVAPRPPAQPVPS